MLFSLSKKKKLSKSGVIVIVTLFAIAVRMPNIYFVEVFSSGLHNVIGYGFVT